MTESFRTLSAVIAAHPNQEIVGRTRLQKTICLLQRLGLPTDYLYTIHFYGPYSEDLHSELRLLKNLDMVTEEETSLTGREGVQYTIKATELAQPKLVGKFQPQIDIMAKTETVVLELAATYDYFRHPNNDHASALERLRYKKGSKCKGGNEERALDLLAKLAIPSRP